MRTDIAKPLDSRLKYNPPDNLQQIAMINYYTITSDAVRQSSLATPRATCFNHETYEATARATAYGPWT